ncbi:bifunctional [glutamine synthetase] adenylyltransferase/[glutamine synthetase]-adenylyl-L-tyrosine phosphorylase [Methylopila sp. Yamaguchi]|uniref:bifunctional [glutamine synthetase] adenylyltransferase/[glutamine synthetase]-adenylyl-L-tyrosine phosphorylase n=1 Tax=Methylopila sp. Yamaguchi TaxID=1437817 RepID=UPI000CB64F9F|nr:bifunctional [glutamine synthetase] adenylyltransferase/[glutamine synthetase]-adenylyl-L-tyrosine phosphorylase [Methylopila sp. Yamaguchi]GBD47613.1 glutamine synthetase adenylyltransferase [Methylopila sp. Yamaguchi]
MTARKTAAPASAQDNRALAARLAIAAQPAEPKAARAAVAALLRDAPALAESASSAPAQALLEAVADGSPFLWGLILRDPARAAALFEAEPERRLGEIVERITAAAASGDERAALARALRRGRAEAALLIAFADLGGVWDCAEVTRALSDVADAAIAAALRFALREAAASGKLHLPDIADPETGSGLFVLGMGKLGARELNYSSDVDLVVFFDPLVAPVAEGEEAVTLFVRVAQSMAKLLQERTADGYVARVDLRLRPDPGATPVALSRDAAMSYYETVGQNWERAAMIKARVVAGDRVAGESFLKELRPFIWRRSLDHASISDIHAMKRQIHAHKGHGAIAVEGHNLKLGRGGIREIEFFVQTQQLVAGGRDPELQTRGTIEGLAKLADAGWITAAARDEMGEAYGFLRTIEHRLQMVDDAQTHSLPEDPERLAAFARFAGFASRDAFAKALTKRLKTVQKHYAKLFEDAPPLAADVGNLVFTGEADDPGTLETLKGLGYAESSSVSAIVRGWHHGRYEAMRSARARELLTELVPAMLVAFSRSGRPDAALFAFDKALERTRSGVALLALIRANPNILELLADVLGAAPKLGETLARRPRVLDALTDPAFFGHLPDRAELDARIADALSEARSYEDLLDRARIAGQELKTLVALRVAAGVVPVEQAAAAFSRIADALTTALFAAVETELRKAHGRVPGGAAAVVALGKLGGEEMTAASDLDLILLYDHPDEATESDGPRPLAASQYFARLTQRLVSALSAPTSEGVLYEVDVRLRPSGRAGPLATRLKAFETYQAEDAETWEHMALSRARVVAGPKAFRRKVEAAIAAALCAPHDRAKVLADVRDMRALLDEEKGDGGPWNLKHAPGGLVDVEFAAQALQLVHAQERPEILRASTLAALAEARRLGLLGEEDYEALASGGRLQQDLTQIVKLAIDGAFDPANAPAGLKLRLARAAAAPDFRTLQATLKEAQAAVRAAAKRVLAGS